MSEVLRWLALSILLLAFSFRRSASAPSKATRTRTWQINALAILPSALVTLPALVNFFQVNTNSVSSAGWLRVGTLLILAIAIAMMGYFQITDPGPMARSWPLVLLLGYLVFAELRSYMTAQGLLSIAIIAALVAGLGFFRRVDGGADALASGARLACLLYVGGVMVMVALFPTVAIEPCRVDKCSILAGLSLTVGSSGNTIGLFFVSLLPYAFSGLSRPALFTSTAGALVLLDLAGSRAALIACVFVSVVHFIGNNAAQSGRTRKVLLSVLLGAATLMSLWPMLGHYAPDDFSLRGILWDYAKDLVRSRPLMGYGPDFWPRLSVNLGIPTNYSPHNVWLEIAVSLGFPGVFLAVGFFVALLGGTAGRGRLALLAYLTSVLAAGMLEATFIPHRPIVVWGAIPAALAIAWYGQVRHDAYAPAHSCPPTLNGKKS